MNRREVAEAIYKATAAPTARTPLVERIQARFMLINNPRIHRLVKRIRRSNNGK